MAGEAVNFLKVWLSVLASLSYCFAVGKVVPRGFTRLLFLVPVLCLFLYLPLLLTSVHLNGTTAFFIAWLGNFKLLLFAFGQGPLGFDPSISLGSFLVVACLPIKLRRSRVGGQVEIEPGGLQNPGDSYPSELRAGAERKVDDEGGRESVLNYAIKALLLAMLVRVHDYREYLHPKMVLLLYSFHIYFMLEIILAATAAAAKNLVGIELEPQFNKPYLATSLQNFWGRRWNLMVTSILRPTVYNPVLRAATSYLGSKWAPLPAVMATFLVSALMHELVFYYLGRLRPTGEVAWFFVLHGVCLTVELVLKKAWPQRRRFPALISRILTVGFVVLTGLWLFIPQFVRCKVDVKSFEEYAAVGAFLKNVARSLAHIFSSNNPNKPIHV